MCERGTGNKIRRHPDYILVIQMSATDSAINNWAMNGKTTPVALTV